VHHYLFAPVGGSLEAHDAEYDRAEWFGVEEVCRRLSYENEVGMVRKAAEVVARRAAAAREGKA
jgi:hypothetical protein